MKPLFITILILTSLFGFSQTNRVLFNYDIAGNQVKRSLCINCLSSRTTNEIIKSEDTIVEEDLLKFTPEDVISYYPNPVQEQLYLKWELINENSVSKIEIYSLDGKLMRFFNNLEKETTKTISFQEYPTGNYSVLLSYTNGEQKSITIIKQ